MQLKPIRPALAAACAAVLGQAQAAPLGGAIFEEEAGTTPPPLAPEPLRRGYPTYLAGTQARLGSLLYRESDGRILVWENTVTLRHELDEVRTLSLTGVTDLITGASPVGTVPAPTEQIITGASGTRTVIPAGRLPLFQVADLRLALSGAYRYPLGPRWQGDTRLSYAEERDFTSIGIAQGLRRDWNHALTTLALGLSLERDEIRPLGGVPPALAREGSFTLVRGEDADDVPGKTRLGLEWQIGLSQVLHRRLLGQLRYFGGALEGYLTDPYKRISYVSGISGEPLPGRSVWTEKRPDRRRFHGLAAGLHAAFPGDWVGSGELRLFRDDWQVRAWAFAARLHLPPLPGLGQLSLHGRLYRQRAAWFYHYRLADGPGLPGLRPGAITPDPATLPAASADWRLGHLDSLTLGLSHRRPLPDHPWWDRGEFRLALARMLQRDREGLFPTLRAWYAQASLRLDW